MTEIHPCRTAPIYLINGGRRNVGIGLESVEAVVRNSNGKMKIQGENGVFTVYIMLKMLEKEKVPSSKSPKKNATGVKNRRSLFHNTAPSVPIVDTIVSSLKTQLQPYL